MGHGRTWRKRRRRRECPDLYAVRMFSPPVVELLRWCQIGGIDTGLVAPAVFPSTGRGMLARRRVDSGDVIVSIPRSRLVSAADVRRKFLHDGPSDLDDVAVLAAFLLVESSKGCHSEWAPYLYALPESYGLPVCFEASDLLLLPFHVLERVRHQRGQLDRWYRDVAESGIVARVPQLCFEEFVRCWCAVNTRTVHFDDGGTEPSASSACCALAPFLDLLNHSPSACVEAGFNRRKQCYEIVTRDRYCRGREVFICYGPHGNDKLLVDYGFVVPDNPHSALPLQLKLLLPLVAKKEKAFLHVASQRYRSVLEQADLGEVTLSADGCSWKFHTALALLCLDRPELQRWKDFAYGGRRELSAAAGLRKARLGLELCAVARDNLLPDRQACESAILAGRPTSNPVLAARLSLEHHGFLDAAETELRSLLSVAAADTADGVG